MENMIKTKKILKDFYKKHTTLLIGVLISGISLIIFSSYNVMQHQIFKDIIVGNPTYIGSNESGETFSFWISLFLGIAGMIFYCIKKRKNFFLENNDSSSTVKLDFLGIGVFALPILLNLIIRQEINFFYLIVGILYFVLFIFIKETKLKKEILLLIFSIYIFSMSCKSVLDKLIKKRAVIPQDGVYLMAIILSIITIYILKKKKFKNIRLLTMKFQIFSPLLLLTSLTNTYIVNASDGYDLEYPLRYILFIYSLIFILIAFNIFQYLKRRKVEKSSCIFLSTVILLFIIHHYITPLFFNSGDFWHRGEELISWHQLINKKLILYKEYSGTSGLFGLVLGFFHNFILNGNSFDYLPALSLTNIFWCILFGTLIYLATSEEMALMISLIVFLPEYNRVYMLVVFLLILSNSKIIEKRIYWFQMYVLLSILAVFHYPLNGVAATLGAAPFAIIQFFLILKEKLFLKIWKKKIFWFLNILLIYPVIWTLKYALELIKMMRLLSSQSMISDGITLWSSATVPPYWFMRYIANWNLKIMLWSIFVFLLSISFLFSFIYYLYLYLYRNNFKVSLLKERGFFLLSFACIALLINYTYTTMRVDYTEGTSRLTGIFIIFTAFNMLIFLYQYGDKLLGRNTKIISFSFFITLILLMQVKEVPLRESRNLVESQQSGQEVKILKHKYELSDDLLLVNGKNIGLSKLGKGFIKRGDLEYLQSYAEMKNILLKPGEIFWPMMNRELYLIFDNKTPTKIDSPDLTKSLKATRENLKSMKEKPVFLTDVRSFESYYTYKWVIDNGYIMYRYKGIEFWIRPDRYEEVFGLLEKGKNNIKYQTLAFDMQKIPYSFGNSMNSLNNIFLNQQEINLNNIAITGNQIEILSKNKIIIDEIKNPYIELHLPEKISTNNYDFIYLELESNYSSKFKRKIQLSWEGDNLSFNDNRSIWLDDLNGKMLIPVGSHPGWLYSKISRLKISFSKIEKGTIIEIKDIKFMKLNVNRKD